MNLRRFIVLLLAAASCRATPLTATTAVQSRPEPNAPSIGFLKAGTEAESVAEAPDGWIAVRLPGPFSAYVSNDALTKNLEVKAGSPLYAEPRADALVLTTSARGDKIVITGLHGRWTQVRLDQPIVGYIHPGLLPASEAITAGAPAVPPPVVVDAAPPAPTNAPGRPAEMPGSPGPQYFQGRFASTHHWIGPQRPYDWQLLDATGTRIAYLDVSKLLLTEQLDKYVGHDVAVYGAVASLPNGRDLVLTVESFQLK